MTPNKTLAHRVSVLERQQPSRPEPTIIYRSLVSRKEDGSLNERLSTASGEGWRITRHDGESEKDFQARCEQTATEKAGKKP